MEQVAPCASVLAGIRDKHDARTLGEKAESPDRARWSRDANTPDGCERSARRNAFPQARQPT